MVCWDCGLVAERVYSVIPSYIPEVPYAIQDEPAEGALRFALSAAGRSRGTGAYDPRYYWNERFSSLQNRDPLVPLSNLKRIAAPLYRRDNTLGDLLGTDELLLDRTSIGKLCKAAGLAKHNEKWIQIKFRLVNMPIYSLPEDEDEEREEAKSIVRGPTEANWPEHYRWRPRFMTTSVVIRVKLCLKAVREAYQDIKDNFHEHVALHPYPRKSILNFDFLVMRFLYLLCPCCDEDEDQSVIDEACYVRRYAWMLKGLQTRANRREHVAWWYFLVGYIQKKTLYSSPELPNYLWRIHPRDELINCEENKPKCPLLCQMALPMSPNPDLLPRPLKRSEPSYLLQYRPVKRIRRHLSTT